MSSAPSGSTPAAPVSPAGGGRSPAAPGTTTPRRRPVAPSSGRLTREAGLGLGVGVLWLSIIVLLPIAAIVVTSFQNGWADFWKSITDTEALSALRLTVSVSAFVTVVNAILGTLVAWVLVRDQFPGKRIIEVIIDIPFALPTIVAGLVLISLYGPQGPFGINLIGTRTGITVALLFVTLPFVVRSVQPVLIEMDQDVEEAAASLGASPVTVFRRIVLPALAPAILAGSALSFARALGEFGSVILISAGRGRTEVASAYMFKLIESDDTAGAAAVATLVLIVAVLVLLLLDSLQRWAARRD